MKKILSTIAILFASFAVLGAQDVMNSAYFLDGYAFRHEYNPAFASPRSYFALPAVGDVNVGVTSKMGISTFLYPYNGQLTTFMNSAIDGKAFLSKLNKNNLLGVGVSTHILSIGAWDKKGGFTTVGLRLKVDGSVNLPYDLFDFMKNIGDREHYDISGFGIKANSYIELSVGYSRKIKNKVNFGGKIKFLMGVLAADVDIDRLSVSMNEQKWSVSSKGHGKILSGKGLINLENNSDGIIDFSSFSMDFESAYRNHGLNGLIGGYGAALDLGFSYEVIKGLTVSGAVLDLGFIRWNNAINAVTPNESWEFTGFDNVALDQTSPNSLENQMNAITDGLNKLIELTKTPDAPKTEMITCRVNVGVEYKMPFYEGLSVGALYSGKYKGKHSINEGRFALTISPCNWFSLSASYGISNLGHRFGGAINFHSAAASLYISTDSIFWNVTNPIPISNGFALGVPYKNANVGLNIGLVFDVSKRKDKVHNRY